MHYETCPVCGGALRPWRSKIAQGVRYGIERCGTCGFAFVNPRPTLEFLMNFYDSKPGGAATSAPFTMEQVRERERNYPNSSLDARRIIHVITTLRGRKTGGRFLDVGCGYGLFSKAAKGAGFDIVPLELAENDRKIAAEMTGVTPVAAAFENYAGPPGSFAVVLMSQILEHALDINLWIAKARELLEADGLLVIALPNFASIFRRVLQDRDPFIIPPEHLNFFSAKSLAALLRKHGFDIERSQWVSRLPKEAFEKRLPGPLRWSASIFHGLSSAALAPVDAGRLGMIVNVYARKRGGK